MVPLLTRYLQPLTSLTYMAGGLATHVRAWLGANPALWLGAGLLLLITALAERLLGRVLLPSRHLGS